MNQKTHKRVFVVIKIAKGSEIEAVEVLCERSTANRLKEKLASQNSQCQYLVQETKLRYGLGNLRQDEAKSKIIEEWRKQSQNRRTENDMFSFFGELSSNMPELLCFKSGSDPWQNIHSWLIEDERKNPIKRTEPLTLDDIERSTRADS